VKDKAGAGTDNAACCSTWKACHSKGEKRSKRLVLPLWGPWCWGSAAVAAVAAVAAAAAVGGVTGPLAHMTKVGRDRGTMHADKGMEEVNATACSAGRVCTESKVFLGGGC